MCAMQYPRFNKEKSPMTSKYSDGRLSAGRSGEWFPPQEFCKTLQKVAILHKILSRTLTNFSNMYGKASFIDKINRLDKCLYSACIAFENHVYHLFAEHALDTSAITINCFDVSEKEMIDKLNEIVEKEYNARCKSCPK